MACPLLNGGNMKRDHQEKEPLKSGLDKGGVTKTPISIKGIILPASWDAEGNTTALAISTNKEKEYIVTSNEKSFELLTFLRQEVKVTGHVEEIDNRKYITVKEYFLA